MISVETCPTLGRLSSVIGTPSIEVVPGTIARPAAARTARTRFWVRIDNLDRKPLPVAGGHLGRSPSLEVIRSCSVPIRSKRTIQRVRLVVAAGDGFSE